MIIILFIKPSGLFGKNTEEKGVKRGDEEKIKFQNPLKSRTQTEELSAIHPFTAIALWLALLFLPFKGLEAAGILFIVLFAAVSMLNMFKKYVEPSAPGGSDLKNTFQAESG